MAGYKRILLKLSGEALAGAATFGIDADRVRALGREVADVAAGGVQVGVEIGRASGRGRGEISVVAASLKKKKKKKTQRTLCIQRQAERIVDPRRRASI